MSNANSCVNIQKSLKFCQGATVRPGIKRRVYFTSKLQIVAFPTLPKDSLGRPTASKYNGSFTMVENGKWQFIDHLANKAEFKSETQGEFPSQTVKNTVTIVHPAVNEDSALASAFLLNSDNVFIVEDMEGKYRVVGSDLYEAVTTYARDNGQGATGNAATTITIEATDIIDAPYYEGEIVTEDGTINEAAQGT